MKLWNSNGRFKGKVREALEDEMIARVISGLGLSDEDAEAFRGGYFDMAARLAKGDDQGKMTDEQRYAVQVIALMRAALSAGHDGAEDALKRCNGEVLHARAGHGAHGGPLGAIVGGGR
jgi:hypothetical protein